MDRPGMVAKLQRANRQFFDRSDRVADDQVLSDPERVVDQEEDTGDHVPHQRLGAKTDRDADDAGAGQQRGDIDAEIAQSNKHRHGDNAGLDNQPDHRQYRRQAGTSLTTALASSRFVRRKVDPGSGLLGGKFPVEQQCNNLPDQISGCQDKQSFKEPSGELSSQSGRGKIGKIDPPLSRYQHDHQAEHEHPADPDVTAFGRAICFFGDKSLTLHRWNKMSDKSADHGIESRCHCDERQGDIMATALQQVEHLLGHEDLNQQPHRDNHEDHERRIGPCRPHFSRRDILIIADQHLRNTGAGTVNDHPEPAEDRDIQPESQSGFPHWNAVHVGENHDKNGKSNKNGDSKLTAVEKSCCPVIGIKQAKVWRVG